MRLLPSLCLLTFVMVEPVLAKTSPSQPYYGLWGATAKACLSNQEGVNTLEINPHGLYWYETRCRATSTARGGPSRWSMELACEGEGEHFRSSPRLTLATPNKLIIEKSPVTPTKWQTYVRCLDR